MLVVCNGAQKSGSTWLFNILKELREFRAPPERYLTDNSRKPGRNPCIRPDRLRDFLETEDYRSVDVISKNHLSKPEHRDVLMSYPDVRVFDLERDIRDVVVSAYYDHCNRNGYDRPFPAYYWSEGRVLANEIIAYHNTWRSCDERFCMSSYEGLQHDFANEVRRIATTMGVAVDDDRIEAVRQATSMDKLRDRYSGDKLYEGDKFFRKGAVGDWQNHFDPGMTRDMEAIIEHGLSPFDRRVVAAKVSGLIKRVVARQ